MNDGNKSDERLKGALRTWTVQTPLPPRFQENVWKRIEAAERQQQIPSPWAALLHWLSRAVARPAVVVAYVSAFAVIGVAFGFKQARHESAYLESRLGQRYVQSVDPFQMPRGQ